MYIPVNEGFSEYLHCMLALCFVGSFKNNKIFMLLKFLNCQEPSPSALCSSGSESSSSLSLIDKSVPLLASVDSCKLALSLVSSFVLPFSRCLKKVPVRNANKQSIIITLLKIITLK